jgi:hypothetical protein
VEFRRLVTLPDNVRDKLEDGDIMEFGEIGEQETLKSFDGGRVEVVDGG